MSAPGAPQDAAAALQLLQARLACHDLILASARAVDESQPAALAACFLPDGTLVRPDGRVLAGREAIAAAYAGRDPERLTRHVLCDQRIDIGDDTASAVTTVVLWSSRRSAPDGPQGRPADPQQLLGEFRDVLEHTPEGWRIRRREARFLMHRSAA